MFFDSLVHVTQDGRWLGSDRHDARAERLLSEMDGCGVERACLVAIAGYVENETVLEVAGRHPGRFVAVGSVNPARLAQPADAAAAVRALAGRGFAGLKLHPRLHGYDPRDERCLAAIAAAAGLGLPVLLDTLFRQPRIATPHAADAIDHIAHACRGARIVLLHGGGPALLELAEIVRIHDGLLLDVSHTIMRYRGSSLDADLAHVFATLDRRTVLGSDFPEYAPREVLARAETLMNGLAEMKKQNVLFRNLESLFGRPRSTAAG